MRASRHQRASFAPRLALYKQLLWPADDDRREWQRRRRPSVPGTTKVIMRSVPAVPTIRTAMLTW
jgi:hypothetical protein